MSETQNIKLATTNMLIASFTFALMGAFVKLAGESVNSVEIVFFRNLLGLLIILITIKHTPIVQEGGRPWLLVSRGIFGTVALFAVFYNLSNISLAKSITFVQTSPIFTAIFAYFLLKERLSLKAWVGVFIGFIGIVMITKPEGMLIPSKTDILGVFSGVFAALAYTSIRELKKYYNTRVIVLSFLITGTLAPLILLIVSEFYTFSSNLDFLFAKFVMPSGIVWIYLIGVGISALLGQYFITKAYSYAKAGIVATIGYSNIAFAFLLGYLLGDENPDMLTIIGIITIVLAGVMASRK
ncbi:MAG: DMT family transporter [Campylobacterales bacterium]